MRWVVITSIAISVVFIVTLLKTWEIWFAANAAGVIAFLYLVGLIFRTVRLPEFQKRRWVILVIATVVVVGNTISWMTSFIVTQYAHYGGLHTVHKVIFHGNISDVLHTRALETLAKYHQQSPPGGMSLGEIFRAHNPPLKPGSSLLDALAEGEGMRIHLASVTDTSVVLIGQAIFIDGEDPTFKNFDGRTGMTQDRLRLTAKGIAFEIQN